MLGVLNSTLAQARAPRTRPAPTASAHASMETDPAASERQARQEALEAERRAHDAERASVRQDTQRVRTLAENLAAYEAAHRMARANKRRLSSFLVTHTARRAAGAREPRDANEVAATEGARVVPQIPLCGTSHDYEVYYLPRKLVPAQEDALDAQEEAVDDAIDQADDDWDRARASMLQELQDIKARLTKHHVAW